MLWFAKKMPKYKRYLLILGLELVFSSKLLV